MQRGGRREGRVPGLLVFIVHLAHGLVELKVRGDVGRGRAWVTGGGDALL